MKILAVSGSLRKKSFNTGLIRAAIDLKPKTMVIENFNLKPIPFYNQDIEDQALPQAVLGFKDKIEAADGLLIANPEYNRSMSGVLKNALDWASRPPQNSLDGKPIAIMSASPGDFGATRAQVQLRSTLWPLNAYVMPKPEMIVARAAEKFDANSHLTDTQSQQRLKTFLRSFKAWVEKFS